MAEFPNVRFREHRVEDIPALVEISNQTYPDEPLTIEQEEHEERTYPKDQPRRRYIVETPEGRVIGLGLCAYPFWMQAPGVYDFYSMIAPDWQHRGIGQALLAKLEPFAREHGATRLWGGCREDFAHAIRFLAQAGFTQFGQRFESKLDLTTFDEAPFSEAITRAAAAGYRFTTLAAERAEHPDADHLLFDLFRPTVMDVPFPGDARADPKYDTWHAHLLESPVADPAAIFIAKAGELYVGMTSLELLKNGPAITSMTGVLREHRGRGLALALKLLSFRYLKAHGYTETRAHNDTANPPILHLNESLGYQRLPGWLEWEKPLQP